jgi:hypothetical protein
MEGGCLYWLIVSSNEASCVQSFIVDSNKATEEQRNIKLIQIIEYVVCNDHFIHRHFHKLAISHVKGRTQIESI